MYTYNYTQTVNGKKTEINAKGNTPKELVSDINRQIKAMNTPEQKIDLDKYVVINNPDGTITLNPKPVPTRKYTLRDVSEYVEANYKQEWYDKGIAMIDLYQVAFFTNSKFKPDGKHSLYLDYSDEDTSKDKNVFIKKYGLTDTAIHTPVIFTSKSSIELALKILGEETIKKALL